jgi:hypothetical protein
MSQTGKMVFQEPWLTTLQKPLVFVVHSLGGIILKDVRHTQHARKYLQLTSPFQAIRRSETMRERTRLIIFLGTPHRGSEYAGWGQIASNLSRVALQDSNKKILETLEVNNEVLDNIHEEFKQIASKGKFKVHSFQEARGVTGVRGLDGKVSMAYELLAVVNDFRWWITSRPNSTLHEILRLSKASTQIICKWRGAQAGMIKHIVSSLAY